MKYIITGLVAIGLLCGFEFSEQARSRIKLFLERPPQGISRDGARNAFLDFIEAKLTEAAIESIGASGDIHRDMIQPLVQRIVEPRERAELLRLRDKYPEREEVSRLLELHEHSFSSDGGSWWCKCGVGMADTTRLSVGPLVSVGW